jgi:dihydroorotate dehydrogenase
MKMMFFISLQKKFMYKVLIRPFLFIFPPESIHHWLVAIFKQFNKIFFCKKLIRKIYSVDSGLLEKEFIGIKFSNPVGLAAGFDKNASFYDDFSGFGFSHIEIGTVTPNPQNGNPKPRSFRLTRDQAIINRMGMNNLGVDAVVQKLKKRSGNLIIGGNIGKNTLTPNEKAVEDFAVCFDKLYEWVDYFVVNISCPNIGDIAKLQDQDTLEDILRRLSAIRSQKHVKKPILLKVSPDLNFKQIDETIDIIQKIGIDGIVATNTTITRIGLKTDESIVRAIGKGGLSGKPLKERSTEVIKYIKSRTNGKMPVIGVGGIMSIEDAMEKIEAGADLIQIYSGFIYEGPGFVKRINNAFLKKMKNKNN